MLAPSLPSFRGAGLAAQTIEDRAWLLSGPAETGKTYSGLFRFDSTVRQWPDQYILARKTRASMDSTVLNTWRRIIKLRGDVQTFGGEKPQFYTYPNGAKVWIVGFDNPDKILSGEFGGAYINQAEELVEDDWETLSTRVTGRGVTNPNPQIMGDCNPGGEDHWIIQRRDAGKITLLESRHEDNPTLHDGTDWTEQGHRTLEILDSLTGARYWRLRRGLWVGAEGQHFEAWDESKHVIEPVEIGSDWLIWGSLDYGFSHPLAAGVFGLAPNGDIHMLGELFVRKTLIRDVVLGYLALLSRLHIDPSRVRTIAAGHDMWATHGGDDAESRADKWAKAVHSLVGYDALTLERAKVDRTQGAAAIQERLGNELTKPTLFIWSTCVETRKAIPRMVTDPKNVEDVKKINADGAGRGGDDAYDALRYGVMAVPDNSWSARELKAFSGGMRV